MAGEQGRRRGWHWWIRRIWFTGGVTFLSWMVWNAQAHGVPPGMFDSTPGLTVTKGDEMTLFVPVRVESSRAALVFLPGGGVDPDACVPLEASLNPSPSVSPCAPCHTCVVPALHFEGATGLPENRCRLKAGSGPLSPSTASAMISPMAGPILNP